MTQVSRIPVCKDYIERFYKIRTKKGELVPFKLNEAQKGLYEVIRENYGKKPVRIVVLKARQMGISTVTEGIITYFTTMSRNTDSVIIAHDSSASASIYNMTKLFISELPDPLKPKQKLNNARVLSFDSDDGNGLKSSIRVGVANDSTRGQTYRYAHLSEVAFWDHPEEAMLSVMQCVPYDPKTIVIVESTANGFNYFYDLWSKAERGENDFIPVFFQQALCISNFQLQSFFLCLDICQFLLFGHKLKLCADKIDAEIYYGKEKQNRTDIDFFL